VNELLVSYIHKNHLKMKNYVNISKQSALLILTKDILYMKQKCQSKFFSSKL